METSAISAWVETQALPLWSTTGVDAATGTVWEALSHGGRPLPAMQKRMQVQMRQAFCFATAAEAGMGAPADLLALSHALVSMALGPGTDAETGNLATVLNPDATIAEAPHKLQDVAFVLLAIAALIRAGADMATELGQGEAMLARLADPAGGWHDDITRAGADLPPDTRSHVPHMHLFEASTALFAATGETRFRDIAQHCLDLFRAHILQPDGAVPELFTGEWQVAEHGQKVAPGLMAEWIFLLDAWERATGADCGVDLVPIFAHACAARDGAGGVPDTSRPKADTRRLWPQTELLKASVVLTRRGHVLPGGADPDSVADMIWQQYLDVPVPGGWYDKRGIDGALLSRTMPASSFYHVLVALRLYADV